MSWKVKIRKTCEICGNRLGYRCRTFCCVKCRNKHYNQKYAKQQAEWQKKARDKKAEKPSKRKCQCLICGRWYVQVGTHVVGGHKFESAREYREFFDLERKKGIVPPWYRELKGEQCLSNGSWKNIKKGKKFWFIKGDKKAGKYKRSHVTLERLAELSKYRKNNKLRKIYENE